MTQTMTEDEARAILAEVEPPHAAAERDLSRTLRSDDPQTLRPFVDNRGTAVAYEEWRPRATRTTSGWAISGGWLDAPAPPLPMRRDATASARVVVPSDRSEGMREALCDRYGMRAGTPSDRVVPEWIATAMLNQVDQLLRVDGRGAAPFPLADSAEVAVRMRDTERHRARFRLRAYPADGTARGWCTGLDADPGRDGAPGTAEGWATMQRVVRAAERAELTQLTGAA